MNLEKYDHLDVITSTKQLQELCQHLLNDETSGFITVDTEFMRRTTYWAQLCLIQIAGSKRLAIIDPLADSIDLTSFYEVLKAPHLIKVFHASRQDLEIFYQLMQDIPHPLFDTQVAAMVCGFGDSVGYSNLVEDLLKVSIDKSQRFTDWAARPLKQNQLKYAIQDVTHLRLVYEQLQEKIKNEGRKTWIDQEMEILTDPKTYQVDPMSMWKKIKIRNDNPKFLARMQYLAAAREELAVSQNKPRNRIASDTDLLEMSADPPLSVEDMNKKKSLNISKEAKEKFLQALAVAEIVPKEQTPKRTKKKTKPRHAVIIEVLKLWLKHVSVEENIASKLIANSDDLEDIIVSQSKGLPLMRGWRYKVFGKDALSIINGEKALRVENGKLALVD